MSQDFDQKQLRNTLGSFLTGVTVVTARTPSDELLGFTANSFTSVSLEPPLVLVCLANSSINYDLFKANASFAVNILSDQQRATSNTFASPVEDRFAGLEFREEVTGSPIIEDCAAWLDCEMHQAVEGGDHIILIGKVVACGQSDHGPLGYYKGAYLDLGLAKEAVIAAEADAPANNVAVLLESKQGLLLLEDDDDGFVLPTAKHLSGEGGLLESLSDMGLMAEIGFLFSVFEDAKNLGVFTCYRGTASGALESDRAHWFALDQLPLNQINNSAVCSMLQRYVNERKSDAFGIYMGDQDFGTVEKLTT